MMGHPLTEMTGRLRPHAPTVVHKPRLRRAM
jgi:hypothetical protein